MRVRFARERQGMESLPVACSPPSPLGGDAAAFLCGDSGARHSGHSAGRRTPPPDAGSERVRNAGWRPTERPGPRPPRGVGGGGGAGDSSALALGPLGPRVTSTASSVVPGGTEAAGPAPRPSGPGSDRPAPKGAERPSGRSPHAAGIAVRRRRVPPVPNLPVLLSPRRSQAQAQPRAPPPPPCPPPRPSRTLPEHSLGRLLPLCAFMTGSYHLKRSLERLSENNFR